MATTDGISDMLAIRPLKKINKHIEIVGSNNPRLNAMAPDSRETILKVLEQYYEKVAITIVDDMHDLDELIVKKPDLVVLGMKLVLLDSTKSYDDSPKMWLSDYLEKNGISFTGSDTHALKLEFDKPAAKQAVLDAGLNSSAYFIAYNKQPIPKHSLSFPLFVKPSNRGDSKGIDDMSVVLTELALRSKILSIHNDLDSDALVEEYLPGREFSVAVVRLPDQAGLLAMPLELIAPPDSNGNSFLSETVKAADIEKVVVVDDLVLSATLKELAIEVFKVLGSNDYGRIDMRLDAQGKPSFIEANLMPGLSDHGYLARCFKLTEQLTYSDMILSIVSLGFERITTVK